MDIMYKSTTVLQINSVFRSTCTYEGPYVHGSSLTLLLPLMMPLGGKTDFKLDNSKASESCFTIIVKMSAEY
jgi:hypothetical protein